jgi:hypothetical protein
MRSFMLRRLSGIRNRSAEDLIGQQNCNKYMYMPLKGDQSASRSPEELSYAMIALEQIWLY